MSQEGNQSIINKLLGSYIPLYNKDFPLILFWTPKSGCTTLNKWFFYQIGLLEKVSRDTDGDVHRFRDFVYRKEPKYTQELTKNLLGADKHTYKLVRNPYKRAVSSYLHTLSQPWLISIFNSEVYKGLSFKQFLTQLKNMGPNINTIDRHIAPQYIQGEEKFIKNYIQLENFNKHIQKIENNHGLLKSPISLISKSSHHFTERMIQKGDIAEKVFTIEIFTGPFPTFESFYNKETKELVKEIFKKDFEAYGYDKNKLEL